MRHISAIRTQLMYLREIYDPEWDMARDDPTVTYADKQLEEAVTWLVDEVEHLHNLIVLLGGEIAEMKGVDDGYE